MRHRHGAAAPDGRPHRQRPPGQARAPLAPQAAYARPDRAPRPAHPADRKDHRHRAMSDLIVGEDGLARCRWGASTPDYLPYHDTEWGRRLTGDDALYERMTLEAFQSGLSWITILRKRENFRTAFAGFAIEKVASFGTSDIERLLADAGIVRNRAKIEAAIANARVALDLDGGLSAFVWSYAPPPRPARRASFASVPPSTPESVAMAKALRKKGFRFFGPTTAYAMMQATGMVDDHIAGCHVPPGR